MLDNRFEEQEIFVEVAVHRKTGLIVAQSKDLPGLMVAARTYEQLDREIATAIREVLEASGKTVVSVDTERSSGASEKFLSRCVVANARLAAV